MKKTTTTRPHAATLLLLLLLAVTATYAPQTYAQDTFRDVFDSQDYAGDDGTVSWSADWAEINDDGNATLGSIQVVQDGSFPAY